MVQCLESLAYVKGCMYPFFILSSTTLYLEFAGYKIIHFVNVCFSLHALPTDFQVYTLFKLFT